MESPRLVLVPHVRSIDSRAMPRWRYRVPYWPHSPFELSAPAGVAIWAYAVAEPAVPAVPLPLPVPAAPPLLPVDGVLIVTTTPLKVTPLVVG